MYQPPASGAPEPGQEIQLPGEHSVTTGERSDSTEPGETKISTSESKVRYSVSHSAVDSTEPSREISVVDLKHVAGPHLDTKTERKSSAPPARPEYKMPPLQTTFDGLLREIKRLHDESVLPWPQKIFIAPYLNLPEEKICQLLATGNHSTDPLAPYVRCIFGAESAQALTAPTNTTFYSAFKQRKNNQLKMPQVIFDLIIARRTLESDSELTESNRTQLYELRKPGLLSNLRYLDMRRSHPSKIHYLKTNHLFSSDNQATANFSFAKLPRCDLGGLIFSNNNFTHTDLSGCNLSYGIFENTKLNAANLCDTNMDSAILSAASLTTVNSELNQGFQIATPRKLLTLNHLLPAKLSLGSTLKFICLDILTGQGTFPDYSKWQFLGVSFHKGEINSLSSFLFAAFHLLAFECYLVNNLVKLVTQLPFYLAESALMRIGFALQNWSMQNNEVQPISFSYGLGLVFQAAGYAFRALRLVIIEPIVSPDIAYGRARELPGIWQNLKYLSLAYSFTINISLFIFPVSSVIGFLNLNKIPAIGSIFTFICQGATAMIIEIANTTSIIPQVTANILTLFAAGNKQKEHQTFDNSPGLRLD